MDESAFDLKELTAADFATDFFAGLLGGSAGLIVGHPFDTVKVILQTTKSKLGITTCVPMILKQEGPKGFFKGMSYPLASVGFLNSLFFGFNMIAGSKIMGLSSYVYADVFFAGAVAGGIQAIPATPIELVKVKLQAQLDNSGTSKTRRQKYVGPWDCLRKTYRIHGIRGCFRGITTTIMRDVSGFAIYMTSYKYFCDVGTPEDHLYPSLSIMLFAGGMAGVLSWLANFPIDTLKSIMQSDSLSNPVYKNSYQCFQIVVKQEGYKVLWKGFTAAIFRAFPLNAVTLCTYDWTQQQMKMILKKYNHHQVMTPSAAGTASVVQDI